MTSTLSERSEVHAIGGVGRISRGHDLPGILQYDEAQVIAVCDVDTRRVTDGQKLVNDFYTKKTGKPFSGVSGHADYEAMLARPDIDAVVISTPDHWHALIAIRAVEAGKDVYLQKPASLTIAEGRAVSNAVNRVENDSPELIAPAAEEPDQPDKPIRPARPRKPKDDRQGSLF